MSFSALQADGIKLPLTSSEGSMSSIVHSPGGEVGALLVTFAIPHRIQHANTAWLEMMGLRCGLGAASAPDSMRAAPTCMAISVLRSLRQRVCSDQCACHVHLPTCVLSGI